MYRVELKEGKGEAYDTSFGGKVPNVPCGVESCGLWVVKECINPVPNVPCGVERFKA